MPGKILKQVFLNSVGRVVRKVENEYDTYSTYPLLGYQVERYNEQGNYCNFAISKWVDSRKSSKLRKSITTDYFPLEGSVVTDSIMTSQEYSNSGSRLYKQTVTTNGNITIEENRYPDLISMGSASSQSGSAQVVQYMRNKNVIHLPIQQTTKHNGVVQSSTYHTTGC